MRRGLGLAVLAVAARAVVWGMWPPAGLTRLEPSEIAASLVAGHGFVFMQYGAAYHAWKEPLWIALLAATTAVFGAGDLPVMVLQWAAGAGCAVVASRIADRVLGDARGAALAGAVVAANPFLVFYDTHHVHPLSFDTLLFLLLVLSILRAAARPPARRAGLLAGLACGAALWQRGSLLASALGGWAAALAATPRGSRRRLGGVALLGLGVGLALVAPWILRNWSVVGRPVLTTDLAHIVWLGNNPRSNGTYADAAGRRLFHDADPAFRRRILSADETGQYDVFVDETRTFVRSRPGAFARLVALRAWGFVWFTPIAGIEYSWGQARLYVVAYGAVLVLGVLGFARLWRRSGPARHASALVVVGAVAGLWALHSLTALNLKHRVPLETALAVFAPAAVLGARREDAGG